MRYAASALVFGVLGILSLLALLDIIGGDEPDLTAEFTVVANTAILAVGWIAVRRRSRN